MSFNTVRVLVVEDNPGVMRMLLRSLRSLGFNEIESASSADDARKQMGDGLQVDLLFSDIRMEGTLDGYGLACWVKSEKPNTHVLLTTGFTDHDIEEFPVLPKPYSLRRLREKLDEVLTYDVPRESS
ncbi:MAG: response regulator [Myxococcota bacterium]